MSRVGEGGHEDGNLLFDASVAVISDYLDSHDWALLVCVTLVQPVKANEPNGNT
jgi:hypothetical protein